MNLELLSRLDKELSLIVSDEIKNKCIERIITIFKDYDIRRKDNNNPKNNYEAITSFISSKRIEGCSEKTIIFYESVISKMISELKKEYYLITTEDVRTFLSKYQETNISMVTADNTRRIVSSFFSWLENEDYITKSPVRRIHKIKTIKTVKHIFSEEQVEVMRQNCGGMRNLAIIDLLYSTGIRVGELVNLKINDIDLNKKECIVFGKGGKQRKVYYDAKTKIHIEQYLNTRRDDNEYLFVSKMMPHKRLEISGVEIMLRKTGKKCNIENVHPHKFRRTLATKAIDKGMPIEQVQHLLGHTKIDTTLGYAMVDDENVKISHKKYLE